jgi:hypothetical protein
MSRASDEFPELESVLGATLRPVAPRSTFISGLRTQLVSEAQTRKPVLANFHLFLLMMVGITSSILLILAGVRAIIGIIGAMNILRLVGDQANQKNALSASQSPGR